MICVTLHQPDKECKCGCVRVTIVALATQQCILLVLFSNSVTTNNTHVLYT